MSKNFSHIIMVAILFVLALAIPAGATPVVLVDFTNPMYSLASGQVNYSVMDQGITNNMTAVGGTLQWSSSGFGVNGPTRIDDPNEIGILELFSGGITPPVTILNIYLKDLYMNEFLTGNEEARYRINGGSWQSVVANSLTGDRTVAVNMWGVTSLEFTSTRLGSDYAVAGYSAMIPEPATFAFMAVGLLGLGILRKRLTT